MKKKEVEKNLVSALNADIEAARPISVEGIAAKLGKSSSWAYGMLRGEQMLSLSAFGRWVDLTGGMNVARWVALKVNCRLTPNNAPNNVEATLLSALERSTAALHSASQALDDGKVEPSELDDYHLAMTNAIEELERLERALETHNQSSPSNGRVATLCETTQSLCGKVMKSRF